VWCVHETHPSRIPLVHDNFSRLYREKKQVQTKRVIAACAIGNHPDSKRHP
jgi:hypothetical protein